MTTQLLMNLALPNKHNRVVRIMMLVTNYTIEKIRQHQVQQSVPKTKPRRKYIFFILLL